MKTAAGLGLTALILVLSAGASAQPLQLFDGPERAVNTTTPQNQFTPAVATAADGSSLMAWVSGTPGAPAEQRFEIRGRFYDPLGAPRGDDFLIPLGDSGDQTFPDIALLSDGRYVVVWSDDRRQDGPAQFSIRARLFTASGLGGGGEIFVDTPVARRLDHPAVEATADGGFVVVWDRAGDDGKPGSIHARRFSAAGQPLGAAQELSPPEPAQRSHPALARGVQDDFLVVWNSTLSAGDDDSGTSIQARAYDQAGAKGLGPVQVNALTESTQGRPAVAPLPDGDFFVAWTSLASDGADQDSFGIRGRGVDAQGAGTGAEFQVNSYPVGGQLYPAIAARPDGSMIIAWHSRGSAGSDSDAWSIQARHFDASGAPTGDDVQVNRYTSLAQTYPAVDVLPRGRFVVSWQSEGNDGSGYGIVGQRLHSVGPCQPSSEHLCLNGGRFQVEAAWRRADGSTGFGTAVPLTDDTGYFWFFRESNVEMVAKVLDACSFGQRFWLFAGGLTNVEVEMTVTDTETGAVQSYSNPQRTPFQPIQDTDAFATCETPTPETPMPETPMPETLPPAASLQSASLQSPSVASPAIPAATAKGEPFLLLNDGRFRVEAEWARPDGSRGAATGVSLTDDTGYFWFFRESNVEMVLKVLDACSFDGHFWVFAGGLTNVEVTVTVTDTLTDDTQVYTNPLGQRFRPIQDTTAFQGCF
jgi:hypothetical protein